MALILEIFDRRGRVRSRRMLDALPVNIGRALDNDVILDDPYVDAHHARVAEIPGQGLLLEDLDTTNGVILEGEATDGPVPLRSGTVLRIGRTELRVRDAGEAVAPAIPYRAPSRLQAPRWLGTGWGRAAFVAAALTVTTFFTWFASFGRSAGTEALSTALGLVLLGALWAGVWALASRVVVQRFNFGAHFAIFAGVLLVGTLLTTVTEWLAFLLPDSVLTWFLGWTAGLALIAWLVAAHLSFASGMPDRRRWLAGLGSCTVVVLLALTFHMVERDTFTDVPTFSGTIKPVPAALLPTVTTDEFGDALHRVHEAVDGMAGRAVN